MVPVATPCENAKGENENACKMLKGEEVYVQEYRTFEDAEAHLGRFIN